jgi:acyl carrier protein
MNRTIEKLKEVLVKSLRLEIDPKTLPETNLAERLGIDSIKSLEFLVWVENEFGIEIADEDLSVRLVDSLQALAGYIEQKQTGNAAAVTA